MAGSRRKPGALGPHVEGYRSRLLTLGYAPGTVRNQLKAVGQLGRWLVVEGIDASQLSADTVRRFLADRRAAGYRKVPCLRSFISLLEYLHDCGVISAGHRPLPSPLDELVGRYRDWLVRQRGLAPPTVVRYERLARRLLSGRIRTSADRVVVDLAGTDVVAFLLEERLRLNVGSLKGRVGEMRSLLRFLFLEGLTPAALANAVPPVAGWRNTSIPVAISAAEVEQLLASCDRSRPAGIRDFAILMLLGRLGLRSVEVERLELDDLDWRAGELVVRGKARRLDRLPLPWDVGDALVAYLSSARPETAVRRVFLTCRAPVQGIRAELVGDVVRRACRRACVGPVGAHRLRHSLATEMLRRGAPLVEISQVLRHSDLATTAVYAKVDLGALRQVAQPWPAVAR